MKPVYLLLALLAIAALFGGRVLIGAWDGGGAVEPPQALAPVQGQAPEPATLSGSRDALEVEEPVPSGRVKADAATASPAEGGVQPEAWTLITQTPQGTRGEEVSLSITFYPSPGASSGLESLERVSVTLPIGADGSARWVPEDLDRGVSRLQAAPHIQWRPAQLRRTRLVSLGRVDEGTRAQDR